MSVKYCKAEVKRIYGIKGKSSILEWTRQYSGELGYDKRGKVMSTQKKDNWQQTIKEQTTKIKQLEEPGKEITKIIDFYNNKRPHKSIEMLILSEAYNTTRPLKRMWKTYYQKSEKKISTIEKIIQEEIILEKA